MPKASIEIYHGSPNELIVIKPYVDGVLLTDMSDVKVCIYPLRGVQPQEDDAAWQVPDQAGSDYGIFVGNDSGKEFAAGETAQPWFMITATPEVIIARSNPTVLFT